MAPPLGFTDDLATLSELEEKTLLEELKARYSRDAIYTYIGDILVSINPYQPLPLYGEEIGLRYRDLSSLRDQRPHIYATGCRAYQNLQRTLTNQSVLVSGESGAGKTECTKMLVAQIVRLSRSHGTSALQDKIIEVNPLLEAFGNATTLMNDNSSRFGKLIEIMFSAEGDIIGAQITEHMLEKSRVSHQNTGEKNFHIFYCLMSGFTPQERHRYFLQPPEKYRILDPGFGVPVFKSEIDYGITRESMDNIKRIMPLLGFTHQDMDVIFALLCSILHLCNIELVMEPDSEHVIIMNEEEIDFAATLLSVQPEDLVTVLLANIAWVRGERLVNMKSVHQACDGRDALAKALYSRLFSWIVQQINFLLHIDEDYEYRHRLVATISILDMAGFEMFPVNSFEQLCINSANERLQHFFNEHIFSMELQEYHAEGVKQPKVKFTNNSDVLGIFFQRPAGLFSILDDECKLSRTTDLTLVEKLNKQFSKTEQYIRSKHREPVFTVLHYAASVTYRAEGFLDKNRDTLSPNMLSLMENSQNSLVNELFLAKVADTGTLEMKRGSDRSGWQNREYQLPTKRNYAPGDSLSRQMGKKLKQKMKDPQAAIDIGIIQNPNTASAHFRNSLQMLMDKLSTSEPHFIRCIRPNVQKSPGLFDTQLVTKQLQSTGVLETTRIRRQGYSTRLPFQVFLDRYQFIAYNFTSQVPANPSSCHHVLKRAHIKEAQIGHSKVFLKYWHTDQLNAIMDNMIRDLQRIQAAIRAHLTRRHFLAMRNQLIWEDQQIAGFTEHVIRCGATVFHMMANQVQHDHGKQERRIREDQSWYRNDRGRLERVRSNEIEEYPDYEEESCGYRNGGQRDDDRVYARQIQTRGPSAFYQLMLNQVYEKIDDLDPDVWCKVIYLEYEKPVAKFYIVDRDVIVDGSYEDFDGQRIGLGVFRNPDRQESTEAIRSYIGKGVKIRKDIDGSILASRLGKNDVIVKGYRDPANHCLSAEVIQREGRLPLDQYIKIFDMEEYKSQIGIEKRSSHFNEVRLQQLSIVGLSFIENGADDLQTPCWLCIINFCALDALENPEVHREIEQRFAELSIKNNEEAAVRKKAMQEISGRHQRRWSKMNLRQGLEQKEPLRKTRMQIHRSGQELKGRMDYSWDDKYFESKNQRSLAELQQEYEGYDDVQSVMGGYRNDGGFSPGSVASSMMYGDQSKLPRKDWAKIRVTIKEENREEGEALRKTKADQNL